MKHKKPLSLRQKNFCEEYAVDFNASAAARRSGYSKNHAVKFLSNPKVQEQINEISQERRKSNMLKRDELFDKLSQIADNDIESDVPLKTSERLRAMDMLLKYGKNHPINFEDETFETRRFNEEDDQTEQEEEV